MRLFTIGFTKKSAQRFFTLLTSAGVRKIVDVRLNNLSQLAGFAKRDDLAWFGKVVGDMGYLHLPALAPTQTMLDAYRKYGGTWEDYEANFLALLSQRKVEDTLDRALIENGCLLCSEDRPEQCHRRLVAEYLRDCWGGIDIIHLV